MRARVVGITSDGRLIFRSSSGRTVIVTPGSEGENELAPSRRRRDFIPRRATNSTRRRNRFRRIIFLTTRHRAGKLETGTS